MSEQPVRIEPAAAPAAVALHVSLRNAVEPEDAVTVEEVEHALVIDPETRRFLAFAGARAVGTASAGNVYMSDYPEALWGSVWVLEDARRRGVGTALLRALSDEARRRGRTEFLTSVSAARGETVAYAHARGFRDIGVSKQVALDLRGRERPEVAPPADVEITTLAERPELVRAVHGVAAEAFPDIPQEDRPLTVPSYETWLTRDIDRPGVPRDGFFVAVAGDEVVGYANIATTEANPTLGYHAMTGVRRAWRGRGVATALKRATIAWAIDQGLETLETQNDELNAPMRAVNLRLGYEPLPDQILLRGPILPA